MRAAQAGGSMIDFGTIGVEAAEDVETQVAVDELVDDLYRFLRLVDELRREAEKLDPPQVRFPAPPHLDPVETPEEGPGTEPTPQPEPAPLPEPQRDKDDDDFCEGHGFAHAGQPYEYGPLGPGNRATMARGCLVWPWIRHKRRPITPANGGTAPTGYDAGHLIGRSLGGENDYANFSWQHLHFNRRRMYRDLEEPAKIEASTGNDVDYEIWLDWSPPALHGGWVAKAYCGSWVSSAGNTSKPIVTCIPNY